MNKIMCLVIVLLSSLNCYSQIPKSALLDSLYKTIKQDSSDQENKKLFFSEFPNDFSEMKSLYYTDSILSEIHSEHFELFNSILSDTSIIKPKEGVLKITLISESFERSVDNLADFYYVASKYIYTYTSSLDYNNLSLSKKRSLIQFLNQSNHPYAKHALLRLKDMQSFNELSGQIEEYIMHFDHKKCH